MAYKILKHALAALFPSFGIDAKKSLFHVFNTSILHRECAEQKTFFAQSFASEEKRSKKFAVFSNPLIDLIYIAQHDTRKIQVER